MDDPPRPVATSPDSEYFLSIEDALALYARAGLPRTPRTIQRYCANSHLDCRRVEIPYGEKYLITPASVTKHIAYIEETRQTLAGRDEPRQVATPQQQEIPAPTEVRPAPTGLDQPRQTAAEAEAVSRYVARLEGENGFLREQITVKDVQIKDLTERARETNHLIAGLQKMLTPLLGRPRGDERNRTYDVGVPPAPDIRDRAHIDPPPIESKPSDPTGDNSELRL
jgi:hypothetical protein